MNRWDEVIAENESDHEETLRNQEQDAREFSAASAVGNTVDIAVYEQAVKGRQEFRRALREERKHFAKLQQDNAYLRAKLARAEALLPKWRADTEENSYRTWRCADELEEALGGGVS